MDVSGKTASISECSGKITVNLHRCADYRLSKQQIAHQGALYALIQTKQHLTIEEHALCCVCVCVRLFGGV